MKDEEIKARIERLSPADPHKTVKCHYIAEQQPDGSWKAVHEHTDEFAAKRRTDKLD